MTQNKELSRVTIFCVIPEIRPAGGELERVFKRKVGASEGE